MAEKTYDYAFVDENNVVINVCVFSSVDNDLIELINNEQEATQAISCDEFGLAVVGGKWNGEHFLYEDDSRVPPTNMPTDDNYFYEYSWDVNDWIILGPNRLKMFQIINA